MSSQYHVLGDHYPLPTGWLGVGGVGMVMVTLRIEAQTFTHLLGNINVFLRLATSKSNPNVVGLAWHNQRRVSRPEPL